MDAAAAWDRRAREEGWPVLNYPRDGEEAWLLTCVRCNEHVSQRCSSLGFPVLQSFLLYLAADVQEPQTLLQPQNVGTYTKAT